MRNNRHQRQRAEKDRGKWDVMSEAERELLRDLWRKRERRGKRLKKWMVFPSVYLFTFLECERF